VKDANAVVLRLDQNHQLSRSIKQARDARVEPGRRQSRIAAPRANSDVPK